MQFRARWLTWLCLALMLWAAVAESTHSHANNTEAASCSICVAAHTSAPALSSHPSRPVFATIGVTLEKAVTAKAQFGLFHLALRGPPEV
jgi:hypothetical protein